VSAPQTKAAKKKAPATVTPRRTTGTNAPGGEWYSPTNEQRTRPARKLTMARATWEAVDAHVAERGRSEWIEQAVLEKLGREGVKV
jgi:hypothetical protein